MKSQYKQLLLVSVLVLLTALWRVVNTELHIYHLVPVAALGLFSGSVLEQKKWAYLIPLTAMFLSDLGLSLFTSMEGFYGISQVVNYLALALVTLMGTRLVNRNAVNIAGYTLGGSLVFFILSNLGTFLSGYYGYSFSSLIECYTMALPFYKSELSTQFFVSSLISDMAFSAVAFGIYALFLVSKMKPAKIKN
jgi:hypothetical protein